VQAVTYSAFGGPEILQVVVKEPLEPGHREVRVEIVRSGVNPTDWKARRGLTSTDPLPDQVPGHDGAGVIDAVGSGVDTLAVGDRVWVWEAAHARTEGTAQELVVLPADHVVVLPETASFDLGACLGIPFLTAHRCLTSIESGPGSLGPGALEGRTVLVAGGAGAVGNAAIQLARWSSATVISTVSSSEKERLATAAGSDRVINYRTSDVLAEIRRMVPRGVDCIVEVAPGANAHLDSRAIAPHGTIAIYAIADALIPGRILVRSARIQYVLVYTVPPESKIQAVRDVSSALAGGSLKVGRNAGLPLHHFPLSQAADAHAAVEGGAVGKVLIDVPS